MRPVSPPHSSLPDVRLLFLCAISLLCLLPPASGVDAWLCPKDKPTNLFFLPESYNCSGLVPNRETPLEPVRFHVFRPNTKLCSTPASYCKIIRHAVVCSVNLFGCRRESHTENHVAASVEECRQMTQHKRCTNGDLYEHSGIWLSHDDISFIFSSEPFGCHVDHTLHVTKCYLYRSSVPARHADGPPQSAVDDMSACNYKDGTCTLSDGSWLSGRLIVRRNVSTSW